MWRWLGVWLSLGAVEYGAGWECGCNSGMELSVMLVGSVTVRGGKLGVFEGA